MKIGPVGGEQGIKRVTETTIPSCKGSQYVIFIARNVNVVSAQRANVKVVGRYDLHNKVSYEEFHCSQWYST